MGKNRRENISKSCLITTDELLSFEHLKKRYWGQHMWAKGYFAVTVGNLNEQQVQKYIEEQEMHHKRDNFEISSH